MKGYKPDSIYIVAVEEPAARIAKQAREAGITSTLLFTEHFKQKAIDIVGIEKLEGTLFTGSALALISLTPIGTPSKFLKYREKYMKRWPGAYLSATGLYGYNWVYFLAKAMQIAGTTTDVNKIRAACSDALRETSVVVSYDGFTPGGRGYGLPIFVLGIEKGKVRIISSSPYPKDLAAAGEKRTDRYDVISSVLRPVMICRVQLAGMATGVELEPYPLKIHHRVALWCWIPTPAGYRPFSRTILS